MPSEATNLATQREWRTLGYFYDRDDSSRAWRISGSRSGLLGFARSVNAFASDPSNDSQAEHEHFGPYWDLEIGTWPEPEITEHWIAGPLPELARLAALIEQQVAAAPVGTVLRFREAFSPGAPYELELAVETDDFDPAVADSACWS